MSSRHIAEQYTLGSAIVPPMQPELHLPPALTRIQREALVRQIMVATRPRFDQSSKRAWLETLPDEQLRGMAQTLECEVAA